MFVCDLLGGNIVGFKPTRRVLYSKYLSVWEFCIQKVCHLGEFYTREVCQFGRVMYPKSVSLQESFVAKSVYFVCLIPLNCQLGKFCTLCQFSRDLYPRSVSLEEFCTYSVSVWKCFVPRKFVSLGEFCSQKCVTFGRVLPRKCISLGEFCT